MFHPRLEKNIVNVVRFFPINHSRLPLLLHPLHRISRDAEIEHIEPVFIIRHFFDHLMMKCRAKREMIFCHFELDLVRV